MGLEVVDSAEFKELVSKRWKVSISMTIIMLSVYFGFIGIVAYKKDILAIKIGSVINVGLCMGLFIILFAWLMTGIYVIWANNKYDKSVEILKDKLNK